MAKLSSIQKNKNRSRLIEKLVKKRKLLKSKVMDKNLSLEERLIFQNKLNDLPRNSSSIRYRNRCELTGRSRGVYRKFGLSRIKIRELSSKLVKLDQITDFQNNRFDWDVIVQRVESINSRLSAVTVEYDNNTTRSFFGREIFNYTKFGKVVKGEIIDQKYQEKLKI